LDIAIDLGTCRTRIFIKGRGVVLDEPSVIAYNTVTHEIIAAGQDAHEMIGRTPPYINAVFPLANGVISKAALVEDMVNIFMSRVCQKRLMMPRVAACIPGEITEVEQHAVVNALSSCGVRRVCLIEAAKAAAMGSDLPFNSPHGSLVVNAGGGTTDIAVISLGGIAACKTLKIGGNLMDEEIVKLVRHKHSLLVGTVSAEKCKISIGTLLQPNEEKECTLKGRHILKNLPQTVKITSSGIRNAILPIAEQIAKSILSVLEVTPPELLSDIQSDGLTLCGGLANLPGFDALIEQHTELKVTVPENPDLRVIEGCGIATQYLDGVSKYYGENVMPLKVAH
jgi:rod shape-determining protein MreB